MEILDATQHLLCIGYRKRNNITSILDTPEHLCYNGNRKRKQTMTYTNELTGFEELTDFEYLNLFFQF